MMVFLRKKIFEANMSKRLRFDKDFDTVRSFLFTFSVF